MPQIVVMADHTDLGQDPVMLRERINAADFESDRFSTNLVERLSWAVLDANEVERRAVMSPHDRERADVDAQIAEKQTFRPSERRPKGSRARTPRERTPVGV